MNTSPYVDPRKPSQEIWEEFSMSFTPAVQEVVDFAKRIPGFRDLPENDQVSLLKAGTFEVRGETSKTLTLHVILCSLWSQTWWPNQTLNIGSTVAFPNRQSPVCAD